MNRRQFTRTLTLGALGAIFVPKYERWFRPIELAKPPALTVAFPAGAAPGDVAILTVQGLEQAIANVWNAGPGGGWAPIMSKGDLTMYHKVLVSDFGQPVALPKGTRAAAIHAFRGVQSPDRVNVRPDRRGLLLAARDRIVPTFVGHRSAVA